MWGGGGGEEGCSSRVHDKSIYGSVCAYARKRFCSSEINKILPEQTGKGEINDRMMKARPNAFCEQK